MTGPYSNLRLLVVNSSSRRIAGIEIYLEDLLAELATQGVAAALLAENDEPTDRAPIALPENVLSLSSLEQARAWNPSVALVNGRLRADWEEESLRLWPCAYFIHNYHGTCVSGLKRHLFPHPQPCFRTLGPACLALYLPRGCGGSNPFTMLQLYSRETAHQKRLQKYPMLITHSEAMREEYIRNGFAPEKLAVIPFACLRTEAVETVDTSSGWDQGPVRLLFAGRMEKIKGGAELLEAAALLLKSQPRPVQVTLAGNGESRPAWQALAGRIEAAQPGLTTHFPGWLSGADLEDAFRTHHLFVMPSLWPEPFGKGGMEAARFGCPSVGFRIGGIPQWLADGRTGHLADWRGNATANLASALGRALATPEHYLALRDNARREAQKYSAAAHCAHLLPLLESLARRRSNFESSRFS